MEVKVNYSQNRSKTISAKIIDNVMHVYAPAGIPEERLDKVIDSFKKKFKKRKLKKEFNKNPDMLKNIADELNRRYFENKLEIKSIEYSTNQDKIFGVCNHKSKRIRISYRLGEMPDWVRDYVIVHELAHLIEPNHSSNFWNIVNS